MCWHRNGSGKLSIPIAQELLLYQNEIGGEAISLETFGSDTVIPIEGRKYLSCDISLDELTEAIRNARLQE